MEIGKKLREARVTSGLTQEQVAEELHISRQTISNWENEKSYPDIASVVKMSDLYSVSLDDLLKGDGKMLEHLEESTDVVRSNKQLLWAVMANVAIFLCCLLAAFFLPKNVLFMVCVFCLAVVSMSWLMLQIIKRI